MVIIALITAALLALCLLFLYRLWALRRLEYWVDRDAVIIFWTDSTITIPLERIERIETEPAPSIAPRRWWAWPLDWILPKDRSRELTSYATQAPARGLLLITAQAQYLLTPQERQAFIHAVEARRSFGVARRLEESVETAPWRRHWLFRDRVAQALLGGGLLFALVLLAYLVWHFPQIPTQVPLHFDSAGIPDRVSARSALFLLPGAALFIWFFNAVVGLVLYRHRRVTAYLLWGGAWLVSIVGILVMRKLFPLFQP